MFLLLTSKWEVRGNNSPNKDFPLRGPSAALSGSGHTKRSPGDKSLLRKLSPKHLSTGLCNWHFPEGNLPAALPMRSWSSQTPSSQALLIEFRLHHIWESIRRERRTLIGISFIWVWVLEIAGRVGFLLGWVLDPII